jgi:hypothetical protein
MAFDTLGYEVLPFVKRVEYCAPRDLCNLCGLECSFHKLLPYGDAWKANSKQIEGNMFICEEVSSCPPCEPSFLQNYIKYRADMAKRTIKNSLEILQELDPLASQNPEYWARKLGLDSLCSNDVKLDICANNDCETCRNCQDSPLIIPKELQDAIYYNLIRAFLRIKRNDFGNTLSHWNEALSFLGLRLHIDNQEPVIDCDTHKSSDSYPVEYYQSQNENARPTHIAFCNVKQGYTYSGESECKAEILRLVLRRYDDCIETPPKGICDLKENCDCSKFAPDACIEMSLCGSVMLKKRIKAVVKKPYVCGSLELCDTFKDAALEAAACLIKKYWIVTQPMELRI